MLDRSIWKLKRSDRMAGNILLHKGLLKTSEGRIPKGRAREKFMNQIMYDIGVNSYKSLKSLAQNKKEWRAVSTLNSMIIRLIGSGIVASYLYYSSITVQFPRLLKSLFGD